MRKLAIVAIAIALVAAAAFAGGPSVEPDAVVGFWKTEPDPDGSAIIRIVDVGGRFDGTIVWLEKPLYGPDEERPGEPKVDLNNPDPKLRERPILGLKLLEGFTFDGKKTWKKGTIYDPNNGKTYKCKMWLEGPDTLKVRGFVGFSMLGRNATWTRATEEELAAAGLLKPAEQSGATRHPPRTSRLVHVP